MCRRTTTSRQRVAAAIEFRRPMESRSCMRRSFRLARRQIDPARRVAARPAPGERPGSAGDVRGIQAGLSQDLCNQLLFRPVPFKSPVEIPPRWKPCANVLPIPVVGGCVVHHLNELPIGDRGPYALPEAPLAGKWPSTSARPPDAAGCAWPRIGRGCGTGGIGIA